MPAVWFALKKSLDCKTEPPDVHDPKASGNPSTILTRRTGPCGCSRSISNLKDVIHGNKTQTEKAVAGSCSPRSIGSNEFVNPITHEVVFNNSTCELKITGFGASKEGNGRRVASSFVGTLRPGTPGPARPYCRFGGSANNVSRGLPSNRRSSVGADSQGSSSLTCHKCGEKFQNAEAIEVHSLSKHAVTELAEGDSSRRIIEIICRTSWLKCENSCERIERILKVHNMQKTLAKFEEYREMVKMKAGKLPKKHPRCLADGNELLRFYGTTLACSLGTNGSSSLCTFSQCNVCRILRHGFSVKKALNGVAGVFTASTSGRAFESIELYEENEAPRKALIVCRVIAGRVHKPMENFQELPGQSGFDSLAGKLGVYSNIEELYLLNPRALLPCFVVIWKP